MSAPLSEIIQWMDGDTPLDDETTVLIIDELGAVGEGFREDGQWHWASGACIDCEVLFWAEMPTGPSLPLPSSNGGKA
ncbi:MAG: hypothetical protein V4662_25140 [Verrucomicrobiota bacterium]